jgi:hypothetical protein
MSTSDDSRAFLTVSAVVVVLGTVGATVTPLLAGAPRAFVGSIVTSGLLGLVFALRLVQLYRATGAVPLPAATLSVVFGVWFMAAPLLYDTVPVGFLATAGTQLSGLLVAAFGTYLLVAGLTSGAE